MSKIEKKDSGATRSLGWNPGNSGVGWHPTPVPDFFRVLMYDHNYSLQLASQLGQQIQLIFKLICLYQIIIRSLKIFFSEMKF